MKNAVLRKYDLLGKEQDVDAVSPHLYEASPHFVFDKKKPDFHIVVGGDGAILFSKIKESILDGKPVLHVHYKDGSSKLNRKKSLGFTADLAPEGLHKAMGDIAKGDYFTKTERLLDCYVNSKLKGSAVNDISIGPGKPFGTLLFSAILKINRTGQREVLPSPKCDVLLISTKQGSTAWNMSAGGSINIDVNDCTHLSFVNSPIHQSHYLYESKDVLHVKVYGDALIGLDGHNVLFRAKAEDEIEVRESQKSIAFLHTTNTFESLMEKIRRQNEFGISSIIK